MKTASVLNSLAVMSCALLFCGCSFPAVQESAAIGMRRESCDRDSIRIPVEPENPGTYRIMRYDFSPKTDSPMSCKVSDTWSQVGGRTETLAPPVDPVTLLLSPEMRFRPVFRKNLPGILPLYRILPDGEDGLGSVGRLPEKAVAVVRENGDSGALSVYRYDPASRKLILAGEIGPAEEWTTWWAWPARCVVFPFAVLADGLLNGLWYSGMLVTRIIP